jgi:transposase
MENIQGQKETSNSEIQKTELFDHYIAVEWSIRTMAVARMTQKAIQPKVIERSSDIRELKAYLLALRGRKILTIEETTTAQWLYVELHDSVDKIVVCDPYRNRLLSDGPKTDKIDAGKLCILLKAGLLKEVYHTLENDYRLRQLVSAYEDVIKAGVRLQNQRSALYRAEGAGRRETLNDPMLKWIIEHIDDALMWYQETVAAYESQFNKLSRRDRRIRHQMKIPGIGLKGAVKIVATVLNAHRFADKGHYLSYCGLANHPKTSGGRSYGYRRPRFDRTLKAVYKTAALVVLHSNNSLRDYYEHLRVKGIAEHNARNAVARKIAAVSYGVFKNNCAYRPTRSREDKTISQ